MQTKKTWAYHAFQPGLSVTTGVTGAMVQSQFKTQWGQNRLISEEKQNGVVRAVSKGAQ